MDIRGKAVIVAGGAGSIGAVIAGALRDKGANVAIVDLHAADLSSDAGLSVRADLANDEDFARALESVVAKLGKVSALVNCAGLIHSEPLISLSDPAARRHRIETWDATIRSNLTATFVPATRVAEHMATTRTKGVIVTFSSIAAAGNPGQTAYAAAKAGIEAMTTVWARELGPLGIRAVAIAPGFVATDSTKAAMSDAALAELKRRTPLLRLGKAEEIASTVAFVIENDFITGTTIAVDGGLVL